MSQLTEILEKFSNRLSYRELDTKALDISRSAAAGNLGETQYAEWAMVSNDPLVVVNNTATYITVLASRLTKQPFRPEDDSLNEIAINMRLNGVLSEVYEDVLKDGYAYVAVGCTDGVPQVTRVDSRYIMFTGDNPTLKDASDVIIFQIVPKGFDEEDLIQEEAFPTGYVDFDPDKEKVITSYYHKVDGMVVLDVFNNYSDEPTRYELLGLDRIPVVRFYGDKVELTDKRWHYRGIYYKVGAVMKALALAATKIQIRNATSDDSNYIAPNDAIKNHAPVWQNSSVKTYDTRDANGVDIQPPTPLTHDNQFLIESFKLWQDVIGDMLGPVIQSGSEAVTEEEVHARNEVRDAITNSYLSKFVESVAELYRCIQMFLYGEAKPVVIMGGFIESVKRQTYQAQIEGLFNVGKESGLNMQGIPMVMLQNSDLPDEYKRIIAAAFKSDEFKSPQVQQLQQQLGQSQNDVQQLQWQLAITKSQASSRLERQAEWTKMTERMRKYELMFKQWQEEQRQVQEARMEILKALVASGNTEGVMQMLAAIQHEDKPIIAQPEEMQAVEATTPNYTQMAAYQVNNPTEGVANGVPGNSSDSIGSR